jgi:hypothetical protein
MQKAVQLANKIYKAPENNWMQEMEDINIHTIFKPLFKGYFKFDIPNKIAAFIILAYDNDSQWIEPRKDRLINKKEILTGIGVDPSYKIYNQIINYEDDATQHVILNYLLFNTDARWQETISLLEYSNKMILFCNQRTSEKEKTGSSVDEEGSVNETFEYLDQSEIAKINKEKGDLLLKAIEARAKAESILKQMENDFQRTDSATQADFDFTFSNSKKFDITSWEHRIRKRKQETGS